MTAADINENGALNRAMIRKRLRSLSMKRREDARSERTHKRA